MTESPRATTGRWPVVAAVAPAAALLFSGAAAWASLTAPQPAPVPVTSTTEPFEVARPDASSKQLAELHARVQADRRRLDALRTRLSARMVSRAPQAAAPESPRRLAAAPRQAAPPPPVDTSTGASG